MSNSIRILTLSDILWSSYRHGAILRSDGGGKAKAALNPIMGAVKVARFFVGVRRKYAPASTLKVVYLNGQVAVIEYQDDEPLCEYIRVRERVH